MHQICEHTSNVQPHLRINRTKKHTVLPCGTSKNSPDNAIQWHITGDINLSMDFSRK